MTPLLLDRQLFEWFWQDFCLRQAVDHFLLNAFLDLLPLGGDGGGVGLPGVDAVLHWLDSSASSLSPLPAKVLRYVISSVRHTSSLHSQN